MSRPTRSFPAWGYHPTDGARLFELAVGTTLPDGWSDVPHAGQHPHDVELGIEPAKETEDATIDAPARRRRGGVRGRTGEWRNASPDNSEPSAPRSSRGRMRG